MRRTFTARAVTFWVDDLEDGELQLDLNAEAGEVLGAGVGYCILVPSLDHQTVIRDALPELLT